MGSRKAYARSGRAGSILTINGGSSSLRFSLYSTRGPLHRTLHGQIDRIGSSGATLAFTPHGAAGATVVKIRAADHRSAAVVFMDWLSGRPEYAAISAIGHRVVHGMHHSDPEIINDRLLRELHRLRPYDPEHLPREIELIEVLRRRNPDAVQVACFDTAFHHDMPLVAQLLPIPRRFYGRGIRRYGFHGLSYAYLLEELARVAGPRASRGRVILAHLGGGASLAATHRGRSLDTSMGFTPTSGLPMGSRSGDLDPGLAPYLERSQAMTGSRFYRMVNEESGLLGVSGISSDMRDLLAREGDSSGAADAIALFCYQVRKWMGAFAAVLGGVDTIVFSAGIGENCPAIRSRICSGLEFLGVALSPARNRVGAALISSARSRVAVRVVHTDEELMIARSVRRLIGPGRRPRSGL